MISQDAVNKALELLRRSPANVDYFFEKIQSPAWLEPLSRYHLFSNPYGAKWSEDSVSYPPWSPGGYLVRMATRPEAQDAVLRIFRVLPPSDNPRIYEQIADAAAALPPRGAAALIPKLKEGLNLPHQLLLPDKAAVVVAFLADAGRIAEALDLAKSIFAIIPSQTSDVSDTAPKPGMRFVEARGRVDAWEYGEALGKCRQALARADGLRTLAAFADLLEEAIVAGGRPQDGDALDDFSYIWRPRIASDRGYRDSVRDVLVSAVRDTAHDIVAKEAGSLEHVSAELTRRRFTVFQRLLYHLLDQHGAGALPLVQEALDDRQAWGDVTIQPEFGELLSHYFGRIDPAIQDRYLGWVRTGPDLESYRTFRRDHEGREPDEKAVDTYRDSWMRDRLAPIQSALSPELQVEYRAFVDLYGPATEPGPPFRITTWMGERSPISAAEALSMDWPALIALAEHFKSEGGLEGPTEEGLAGSLRERITANPQEAVHYIDQFVRLPTGYLAEILETLRDVIKKGVALNWATIVPVVSQIVATGKASPAEQENWRRLNKAAGSLLTTGFDLGERSIPYSEREISWEVLRMLTEDPDPTKEHEDQYGGSNMDPTTLSLNTVRGEAFHGVVRYALWCRMHLKSLEESQGRSYAGFDDMPEVRAILEKHLNTNVEPSLAVRAVYGQWFPLLAYIDGSWAAEHVHQIFPTAHEARPWFWAAWGAYVVYSQPYSGVLPLLRDVYAEAIKAIDEDGDIRVGLGERPSRHLADHLMAYYWRGELPLTPNSLLSDFFRLASDDIRGHALDFIGRNLVNSEKAPQQEVVQRLATLWDERANDPNVGNGELEAFGWWFGSGQLPLEWSFMRLEAVLNRRVQPEPDHLVVERLAKLVATNTPESVRCFEQMVDLASKGWAIHGWIDSAQVILKAGLQSDDRETRAGAERVVERLGAMRFSVFRDLVKSVQSSDS